MMLFALRYEREGQAQLAELLQQLQDYGLPRQQLGLVRTLLQHAGADKRVGDLFSNRSFSSRFATMAKQSLRVRGVRPLQSMSVHARRDAMVFILPVQERRIALLDRHGVLALIGQTLQEAICRGSGPQYIG